MIKKKIVSFKNKRVKADEAVDALEQQGWVLVYTDELKCRYVLVKQDMDVDPLLNKKIKEMRCKLNAFSKVILNLNALVLTAHNIKKEYKTVPVEASYLALDSVLDICMNEIADELRPLVGKGGKDE